MQNFFGNYPLGALVKASWQAAVLILLVLAVQWALGRRLEPRWRYGLWFLVVLRLALPWTAPSVVSLFNLLNLNGARAVAARLQGETGSEEAANRARTPVQPQSVPGKTVAPASWLGGQPWLWAAFWGAGAGSLGAWLWTTHHRIWRRVTSCRPLIDEKVLNLLEDCKQAMGLRAPVSVIETDAVSSPSLFGFVRPRLLLPRGLTRNFTLDELRLIFLHELGHIRRHDILVGWLMTALQIVHWFNPLVWLAFYRMRAERELACDALALSYARDEENQLYGRTMIKLLERFGGSAWAPSLAGTVESKNQLKERITMIAKYRRSSRGPALAGALFIGLGLVTLTDAQSGSKSAGATAADEGVPTIVATSPVLGSTDVNPSLNEITVTFDRDMGRGFSWTGGGPDYPASPEGVKAKWRDKRTCALPVKIEAGRYYRVGINSKSYRNFQSADGVPAMPSAIYFTTSGASEELKARTIVPRVVASVPANGDQFVNPALSELRVTFDVAMGEGLSWCTVDDQGADFPKGPEGKRAYWTEDHRTCVLPVELQPGKTYRLSLNEADANNFQSADGVPMQPMEYSFKTTGQ
jgi:beta-lactamase regulating signal transducer with metallopeptidase domain